MLVEVLSGQKGGCSEEHSPEEGMSCCVEPVLPVGLPEPGQAIPSAPQRKMQSQRSVNGSGTKQVGNVWSISAGAGER